MGFKNYFKANKADASAAPPEAAQSAPALFEKGPPRFTNQFTDSLEMSNSPRFGSSRASLAPSTHSSFVDEIKHEVMCNYLYQQQCSHLWVSDGSGELEGILLRKSRNQYMACPPQLASSDFARACASLNVQVCSLTSRAIDCKAHSVLGCYDC